MAKCMRQATKDGDHGLAKKIANKLYTDLNAPDLIHECKEYHDHCHSESNSQSLIDHEEIQKDLLDTNPKERAETSPSP